MKIAIYHNLEKGGALNQLIEIAKILQTNNNIDLYSSQDNIDTKIINKKYIFPLCKTNNIIQHLHQIFIEKNKIDQQIGELINKNNYDLVLIFPCLLTQSPYILKFLDNKNSINLYFFTEPKREFYEQTSFDYFNIKKIITRTARYGIKLIDKNNCKKAKNIIANSYYTASQLKKIYNKKSFVIYPGLVNKINEISSTKNNKILSVGLHSYIKGHDFSIKQLNNLNKTLTLLGRKTKETKKIINIAKNNNVKVNFIFTENDNQKNNIYSKYGLFLSNSKKEPFGITTLEATSSGCYVLGINYGGTPEIIDHGINGFLYPNNVSLGKKIVQKKIKYNKLTVIKNKTINWNHTVNNLLYIYHYLKHQPND